MSEFGRLLSVTMQKHCHSSSLCIGGQLFSYRAIDEWSRRIAARLQGQMVGILAGGSFETYAGVLAVARSGRTYIPLNPEFPDDRLLRTIAKMEPDALIVDRDQIDRACSLLCHVQKPMHIIIVDAHIDAKTKAVGMHHSFVHVQETSPPEPHKVDVETDDATPLYIMSTSGSTGAPKSIAIPRQNVVDYLNSVRRLFDFRPEDRFSHFFKLSFDLSVHDMFVAWTTGACLYVPGARDLLDPVAFASRSALTVWFSVPSLVSLAIMSRKLDANTLPKIRHAIFCGEALSWENVDAFRRAAPGAQLTNLYGPTEATIAITHHTVGDRPPEDQERQVSVPIGRPFDGQEALVVSPDLCPSTAGESGELLLGGSQLAPGYVGNPEQTAESFLDVEFPGFLSKRWYRTGDIVTATENGLVFLGRSDTQVKFRGHRIELGEIEAVLQKIAKAPVAIVIAWPPFGPGPIERLLAFLMPPHEPPNEVHAMMRDQLPSHMLPSRIISIDHPADMILNDNQKIDRTKIARMYQSCVG